jgi:hypothetical protein
VPRVLIPERVVAYRSARGRPYRRPAAILTALAAVIATSLMAGPGGVASADEPCGLPRAGIHHSLGLDTWASEYPRPDRSLDAALLFLSFPDSVPSATPDQQQQHAEDVQITWNRTVSSAELAYILYQVPVLVAIHASRMLPGATG